MQLTRREALQREITTKQQALLVGPKQVAGEYDIARKRTKEINNAFSQYQASNNRETLTALNNANVALLKALDAPVELTADYLRVLEQLGTELVTAFVTELYVPETPESKPVMGDILAWMDLVITLQMLSTKIYCQQVLGMEEMPIGNIDFGKPVAPIKPRFPVSKK